MGVRSVLCRTVPFGSIAQAHATETSDESAGSWMPPGYPEGVCAQMLSWRTGASSATRLRAACRPARRDRPPPGHRGRDSVRDTATGRPRQRDRHPQLTATGEEPGFPRTVRGLPHTQPVAFIDGLPRTESFDQVTPLHAQRTGHGPVT